MSALRKVKFAVLESSLLARKGDARPAYPQHAHEANAVTRVDDYVMSAPTHEAHGHDPESTLASLINRPVMRVPTGPIEPAPQAAAEEKAQETGFLDPPAAVHEPEVVAEPVAAKAFVDEAAETPAAPVAAEEPTSVEEEGRSLREVVKVWTRKVAKDRRVAANLHPRGLNREQAALYVGLSASTFNKLVAAHVLPAALAFGRRRVWDRRALDKALDAMSGMNSAAFAEPTDA
jgi:hypothetical protein